ncbi:MAG: stage II sporulation protein R [Firmicutes bacterium]|nr:stage II sporulation protein R [Bacillota bacterium]
MVQIVKVFAFALVLFSAGLGLARDGVREEAVPAYDPEGLIRLHVVANSDSDADQALKLKVRDEIVRAVGPVLSGANGVAGAKKAAADNIELIKEAASRTVRAEGKDYPVDVKLDRSPFPTRSYGAFILPAGDYEAVRVTIGRGDGANWWCVLFPPLCFAGLAKSASPAAAGSDVPAAGISAGASSAPGAGSGREEAEKPAQAAVIGEETAGPEQPVVFKSRIAEWLANLFT